MGQRKHGWTRRITLETAKRYLNRFRDAYMSSKYGTGWKLYRYITPSKPNSVGNAGRESECVAHVICVPSGLISGNYWANPSRER